MTAVIDPIDRVGTGDTIDTVGANPHRFHLHRAGLLNVWQYDDQVFDFAGGRLLLRGANGAGKSKTLEVLLPFALDGDKLRITASGRHHTSLLWLMTDGTQGNRTGYVWVELVRDTEDGQQEVFTCGVGIRASSTAKTATSWHFTCPRRIGVDLLLEDDAGPLSRDRCRAAVEPDGHFFDQARAYKQHVGRELFGLDPVQYDQLLRLLYWLRQPQVGEDIEPAKLAEQLAQALPHVDDDAIRSAGDTFDELEAFGEAIERRGRAARAIAAFAEAYGDYARAVARERGAELVESHRELARRTTAVEAARSAAAATARDSAATEQERRDVASRLAAARARERELEASPEARSQRRLLELQQHADQVASTAGRALETADGALRRTTEAGARVSTDRAAVLSEVVSYGQEAQARVAELTRAGVVHPMSVPSAVVTPRVTDAAGAGSLQPVLTEHAAVVAGVRPAVGQLLAAVRVVEDSRDEAERAVVRRDAEDRRAAEAERRAEAERGRQEDAATAARSAEVAFADAVEAWHADSRGTRVDLPELTASNVPGLAALARAAAAPELAARRAEESVAAAARIAAADAIAGLQERRRAIESERDPAPPAPTVARSPRDDLDGAPLWRLLDFAADTPPGERAGLEAALEGAGLLDAWVRADGAVLGADRLDVVLPLGAAVEGRRTLADVVVPDVPDGCPVPAEVVRGVLTRVALETGRAGSDDPVEAAVGTDGSWRLGVLTGRTRKVAAQFIGATARAGERARRLAEVDAEITAWDRRRVSATATEEAARARLSDLDAWLTATPDPGALLQGWLLLDERTAAAQRAQDEAASAGDLARRARSEAAQRRRELEELARTHGLPTTADGLAARAQELRELDQRLARHADAAAPLVARLGRWAQDWARWRAEEAETEALRAEADGQRLAAEELAAARDTLQQTVGASVEELQRRLAATRAESTAAVRRDKELGELALRLRESLGAQQQALANAEERVREQQVPVVAAAHALAAAHDVPGLVGSALARDPEDDEQVAFGLARGVDAGEKVPGKVVELARRLAGLAEPRRAVDQTGLAAAWREASTSDAAEHEPRLLPVGGAVAALGRDDGGDHPVAVLAGRLAAAVAHDRELLTERERTLFEEHLTGDLGEVLRQRRLEATDLVESMNRLLRGVTTSQGIAVRLQWQLREDVPEDARQAVRLLGQPVGALLPSERAQLRDALHRLIEASRSEAPEDSYAEHLARALDYRAWFAFHIRYTRPEMEGRWQALHRRSPLSQGEQKVVCYLPLFAAAAAHFTSLAGAAPYAPRFILLDDAFPKIDVRTHPLLFGLLVALDLDFVVTSERLWGDHQSVPALAIYEALRDPGERGIAQYRYLWDGARLHTVGT